jgi:DNA invertase Pin-like site-specific DNA recombinase
MSCSSGGTIRFARSTQALVHALHEFHRLGVDFVSYQENIDTTTP